MTLCVRLLHASCTAAWSTEVGWVSLTNHNIWPTPLFRSPQTPWHAHTHSIQRVNGLLKDTCLAGESSRKLPGNFLVICMDHINDNLRPCCLLGLVVGSSIRPELHWHTMEIKSPAVILSCSVAWADEGLIYCRKRRQQDWLTVNHISYFIICKSNIDCRIIGRSGDRRQQIDWNLRSAQLQSFSHPPPFKDLTR